jgi:exodeoxyribonuclease V beta subunit
MDALENFAENSTDLYDSLLEKDQWVTVQEGVAEKANLVKDILARTNEANSNTVDLDKAITEQKVEIASLQGKVASASIMQYSYSSLSGRAETPIAEADDSRTEKEGESTAEEIPVSGMENYPRGSKVGDALHNILERMRFMAFGERFKSLEDALGHTPNIETSELENVIEEEFKAQSLPIAAHKKEWTEITARLVWNTLHASLPVIEGAEIHRDATFRLVELPLNDHKPEVQFGMNAYAGNPEDSGTDAPPAETEALTILHRVCKGFIDLLFVREVNKQKRYSILDWKSDSLENYGDAEIKKKVDEDYSVQRVLYSYCLIQWLKQFYGKRADGSGEGLDEQQIFEQHFGGIYYAFLRGTDGATGKGIYAHTWKDYASLEKAYGEVKKLMSKKKKDEGEN